MPQQITLIVMLAFLTGCGDTKSPLSGAAQTPAPPEDEFHHSRYGYYGCFVGLNDGTSLELFQIQQPELRPDQFAIMIQHSIILDKKTLAPSNPNQQPLKSLSYSVSAKADQDSDWVPFTSPVEDGHLVELIFNYNATLTSGNPDLPIHLKVESQSVTYTLAGPPVSTFTQMGRDPNSLKLFRVPHRSPTSGVSQ